MANCCCFLFVLFLFLFLFLFLLFCCFFGNRSQVLALNLPLPRPLQPSDLQADVDDIISATPEQIDQAAAERPRPRGELLRECKQRWRQARHK